MTRKEERERRIRRNKLSAASTAIVVALLALGLYLRSRGVAVLNPAGQVAGKERTLMVEAVLLGLIVIVPVYILTVVIAWKYRENSSSGKKYSPDWDHSRWLEGFWWAVPLAIIGILSVITWRSSYALDPFKALNSNTKPLTVQVVALDWKWLFVYPEQKVASVNQVQIPVGTPVTFDITSDSVMNSFWVPRLGGQIYAMTGMSTQLHLMTGKPGTYSGSSANISGSGFAGMAFTAKAESQADFASWVSNAQKSQNKLTLDAYNQLAKPSKDNPIGTYSLSTSNLYDYIVMKYMEPGVGQ
ncbi:MAG TPA: ubiquinol oxidase subunit II [Patescibacteria group bacterium]|nr:ubiquinol oxidase subunit II [Patescibacteria group bacterium]